MLVNRQLSEQGRPAGFVSRLIAVAIDLFILVAIVTVITLVGQWLVGLLALGQATKILVAAITGGSGLSVISLRCPCSGAISSYSSITGDRRSRTTSPTRSSFISCQPTASWARWSNTFRQY
jgi:hypothetical protein